MHYCSGLKPIQHELQDEPDIYRDFPPPAGENMELAELGLMNTAVKASINELALFVMKKAIRQNQNMY